MSLNNLSRALPTLIREFTVVPAFYKEADLTSFRPASCYADTYNQEYPIDSPANAVISKAYATKTAGVPRHVEQRIDKALDIFGVPTPRPLTVKSAGPKEENVIYLLPEHKKYPIKTAADIPEADRTINRVHRRLSTKSLAQASSVLVKVAAANGREVSDNIMRWAGLKMCDVEKTADWLDARGSVSNRDVFSKLAEKIRGREGPKTRRDLVKLASAIGDLDSKFNLEKFYGRTLPNPLDTVFSSKEAMANTVDLGSKQVNIGKLMSLPVDFYSDVLGEDIAEEISTDGELDKEKLLTILPTLPSDMKHLLCSKMEKK
jgi:hypothetical protein